ncbi:helix-turn-helix domain-containing protein [Clostridium perfringens]|uniref:helix-turn-helix domain-containing protein n=2 Tax=Clostridium perfringens TaxID=1502 RepID=UPI0034E0D8BA
MGKIINLLDWEEIYMNTTIWAKVDFSPNKRPAYTKYEISKEIKEKRNSMGLSKEEFANKYDIEVKTIQIIEEARKNFNVRIYNACSKILGKSIKELTKFDEEDLDLCISFRKDCKEIKEKEKKTIDIANHLFNEMVMQYKTNV